MELAKAATSGPVVPPSLTDDGPSRFLGGIPDPQDFEVQSVQAGSFLKGGLKEVTGP
jgi:hypothetical protein